MADDLFQGLPPPSTASPPQLPEQPAASSSKRDSPPPPAPAPILKSALKRDKPSDPQDAGVRFCSIKIASFMCLSICGSESSLCLTWLCLLCPILAVIVLGASLGFVVGFPLVEVFITFLMTSNLKLYLGLRFTGFHRCLWSF